MGCCYSYFCKDDNSSQIGEPNERTHLLVDPVSNNASVQRVNSNDVLSSNFKSAPKKNDEQSALTRILQETSANVIDVAALDSHNLQHHEYVERTKHYNLKVQQVCVQNKTNLLIGLKNCLLKDVPLTDKSFTSVPIEPEDKEIIISTLAKAVTAIADIKIEHKEDLVVPLLIRY